MGNRKLSYRAPSRVKEEPSPEESPERLKWVSVADDEDLLFADGFDKCVIGVTAYESPTPVRVVYSCEMMVRQLLDEWRESFADEDVTRETVLEYLSFNT